MSKLSRVERFLLEQVRLIVSRERAMEENRSGALSMRARQLSEEIRDIDTLLMEPMDLIARPEPVNIDAETEAEIRKPCQSLDHAANKAAQYLPEGCQILIELEKDGYNVSLVRPFKGCVSVDGGDGGIVGDVNEAIRIASGATP